MHIQKVAFGEAEGTARRLDQIGRGIFAVMLGAIWLVPVVSGAWLIGFGILLLALNGIRSSLGIPLSGFWLTLGVIALTAGLGEIVGIRLLCFGSAS